MSISAQQLNVLMQNSNTLAFATYLANILNSLSSEESGDGQINLGNGVVLLQGAGSPVDGDTGTDVAGTGSLYIDRTAGALWVNIGDIDDTEWELESSVSPISAVLTGYSSSAGTVGAADTILVGFNKLNGNQVLSKATADAALPSASFTAGAVTAKVLTGLAAGAASTILSTDTILVALAKLQAQIDAL